MHYSNEIVSLKEARERGLKRYFTGVPCKHGHLCERHIHGHHWCVECKVISDQRYRIENREKVIKRHAIYRKKNHEKISESGNIYRLKNEDRERERLRKYRREHPEIKLEGSRKYHSENREKENKQHAKYKKDNPDKNSSDTQKRRAKKLHAIPPWITSEQCLEIEGFYRLAKTLTVMTGIPQEVDHIHPLQGKTCSGLHVPWNLQVITASENRKKHNKLIIEEAV